MGRRTRGDGSLAYDASRGRWVGRLDVGRDPETGKRHRLKVSAATKAQCKDKLDDLRDAYRRTGMVPDRTATVEHALRDWLANLPPEIHSPSTVQAVSDRASHIIAGLGKVRLVQLTPSQVERFLAGMAAEGYATATIARTRSVLIRAIRRAERDGLVARNAAQLASCPRGTRRQSKALTLEQVGKLLGLQLTPWWRAYIVTAIMTGLRPGELLGLRWEDVDTSEGVIRVRKCLKRAVADGRVILRCEDLKTERSRRTLRTPAAVAGTLAALKREQAADKLRLGRHYQDNGLVFCDSAGRPRWRFGVARQFKVLCERAGIPGDWRPYEARHTFVSLLSDAGVAIEDIADAAGHVNANITRAVYRHQLADVITKAPAAMDAIFGGSA
jgi:integrase